MAGAPWGAVLNDSARSGRKAADEITPVHSPAVLRSGGSDCSGVVDSRDSCGSRMVARSRTSSSWRGSRSGVPSARLVVRLIGRGLGGAFKRRGCFRPLGSRGVRLLHKRQGAPGHRESSLLFRAADKKLVHSDFCGQLYSDCLSSESGGNTVSFSEFHCSADLTMVGDSSSSVDSPIHHGPSQCFSGLVISPESSIRVRMDTQDRGVSRAPEEVASVSRPVYHLTQSPMFTIFFTVPQSECSGYGCSAPELGWVAGVCLSTLVSHSSCPQEAPVVLWGPTNHRSSLLASEAVVSRPSRPGGGWSGGSSSVQGPPASTTLPLSSSGSVRAVASCLETIQRFARARGFPKHVAQQAALARRPSLRAGYQTKWSVYRQWCHSEGHSVSRPSLSKVADFLFWHRRSKKLSVSSVLGYRSMLSAVFRTILPEISTSPIIRDLLRSFQVEAPSRSVRPPSWDLIKVLDYLRSPVFEPLSSASLRDLTRKTLFLVALATAKRVGELQALLRIVSFSSSSAGLSYVPEFLAKTETAAPSTHFCYSVSWGFCGRSSGGSFIVSGPFSF